MDIKNSIITILNTDNEIVGTGFVAADCLIVTCAHVIDLAKAAPGGLVRVRFAVDNSERFADVDASASSPKTELDVAILRVSQTPKGVQPLRMSASAGCSGHIFFATGYPQMGDFESLSARGEIISIEKDKRGDTYLQLRSQEVVPGMSGGPVLDTVRNAVVGMINSGFMLRADKKHRDTAFATPSETIWQICPQLKPSTPILPRRNPIVEGIHLLPYDYDQRIQNFLTEYLGTDTHPVPFGGRDDALKMLDGWLAETTPYLLLAAPAGRGKSALLVRWLDSVKAREDLSLAFVPVSIRFGTNMERVFYAALAARLAFLHGDDIPASPETSTAVYRGLVSDYLSKPLANGRTLLVVLDGLDEAADWQAGADFMPNELPAGVRVVVSARFLAGDADSTSWLSRLNWERNGLASAPSLTPLDQEGVRDVLFKMGCPLDELSRNLDIVAELYRLSVGDPLLVNFYVYDLWQQKDKAPRLKPDELRKLKPGYHEYFKRWWKDQKELWGEKAPLKVKTTKLVFNLLCGAIGALTIEDLIAMDTKDELDSFVIEDAIETLDRFVISVIIDERTEQAGYVITHPKFRDYFWDKLSYKEQNRIEDRFLKWGEHTFKEFVNDKRNPKNKDEVPFYVVLNYRAHLARSNQPIEKWLHLIHHQQWAQAWFTVEGAYGGYAQDVQHTWEQCRLLDRQTIETIGEAHHMGHQIRCGLIKASLHSLASNIPSELIWPLVRDGIWMWPQAWVVIRQMPEPAQQAETIIGLIPHLKDNQLSDALAVARTIQDDQYRADVLVELAQQLPGIADEALSAACAIQYPGNRASSLVNLARCLPERMLIQVLAETRTIRNESDRVRVLSALAQRLPEAVEEALVAVRASQNELLRANAFSELAKHSPDLIGEALAAARAVRDKERRAEALCALAQYLPDFAEEALIAAQTIQDEKGRAYALIRLAKYLSDDVVLEILTAGPTIQNEWQRMGGMLFALAEYLPEGKLVQVLERVSAIQDKWHRSLILKLLAERLPENELMQVLVAIRSIQHEEDCASALSALVSRFPTGELIQLLATARSIKFKWDRALVLSQIAQRLPGVAREALTATEAIHDEVDRVSVISSLAVYLPELVGEALTVARAVGNKWYLACILGQIAQCLPEVAGEALAVAESIKDEVDRARVLNRMALYLPQWGLEQVIKAAQTIQDEEYRARVLSQVAQRMQKYGLLQVLEATYTISNERFRARILSRIAQHIPEDIQAQILEAAHDVQDEQGRACLLSALAWHLSQWELENVLDTVRNIQNEEDRASALCALAQRIPEVAGEALATAKVIWDEEILASVLGQAALHLPINFSHRTLAATQTIKNKWVRSHILSNLVDPLMRTSKKKSYQAIETAIDQFSVHTRDNLLSDISALLPVLLHLSIDGIDQEILQAVRDVTTWWP